MSNIVERLRERSQNLWTYDKELKDNLLVGEAADEIERLQRIVKIMQTLTLKDMPQ